MKFFVFITILGIAPSLSSVSAEHSSGCLEKISRNITAVMMETLSDIDSVRTYELVSSRGMENSSDARELFLRVPVSDSELDSLCLMQNKDGSWPDIDYADSNRGAWQPSIHAFRVCRLAIKYKACGNVRALESALSAINFWAGADIKCPNWWHNEIGIPRLMGPAFVLLRNDMPENILQCSVKIMSASSLKQTGQNKIWQAGNVLIRGLLQDDEALVSRAREALLSELGINPDGEGLQPDWSFHQHGPQMQFGNYGLSYAVSMSWWARVLEGTGLDFPEADIANLRSYVREGLSQLLWKGYFDQNACARQVFPLAQKGKALCVAQTAKNLGVELRNIPGGRYFPCSDFGVYVGNGWYASIRMQSVRTIGFETTNGENMKGYFSSDGALLVRKDGDEYDDIAPVWEWRHVPGVTAWDDGTPIWGNRNGPGHTQGKDAGPYNKASSVSARIEEGCMVVAMDYDRDTLTCRKAYFFFDGGVVCLAAGITKPGNSRVVTTVEQNWLKGEVLGGRRWAYHRGISYLMLSGNRFTYGVEHHVGKWSWMMPSLPDSDVEADVFEMLIDHGTAPKGASCAYAVLPGVELSDRTARRQGIKVLCNNSRRQTVRIHGRKLSVNWENMDETQ